MRDKQLVITGQDLHKGRARTGAWHMGHCVPTQCSLQRIQVSIDLEEATGSRGADDIARLELLLEIDAYPVHVYERNHVCTIKACETGTTQLCVA